MRDALLSSVCLRLSATARAAALACLAGGLGVCPLAFAQNAQSDQSTQSAEAAQPPAHAPAVTQAAQADGGDVGGDVGADVAAALPDDGDVQTLPEVQVSVTSEASYADPTTSSATKLILTNRETPQSTTVITRRQMQDWGHVSIADVLSNTTGIYTSNAAGFDRPRFNVRGGTANLVQIDGVEQPPFGRRPAVMGDSVAYERVEILRGANGLLTGAGNPTATINMIRKRATARQFGGNVAASVGSWSNYRAEFDLGTPLASDGAWRARVAGAHHDKDSFVDRWGKKNSTVYATVEGNITPRTLLRTGVELTNTHTRGGINNSAAPYYFSDGSLVNAPRGATGMSAHWSDWPTQERTVFAGLDHGFDNGWFLNSAISYNSVSMQGGRFGFIAPASGYLDPDGSHPMVVTARGGNSRFTLGDPQSSAEDVQKTVDVNLQGPLELLGRTHELVLGVNGYDRNRRTFGYEASGTGSIVAADWNYFRWTGDMPRYNYTQLGRQADQGTRSLGGFAAARWSLGDSVKLITGARLSNWSVKTRNYDPATGAFTGVAGQYKIKRELSPYLGLVWDVAQDWSVYASYTDAFQPQSYFDANDNVIEPVVGRSYEIGAKAELLDKRLNLGVALFQSRLDNVAEVDESYPDTFRTPAGNRPYRSSGKGNKSEGVELEASGEILPGWNLYAGLSHTRTKNAQGLRINKDVPSTLLRLSTAYALPDTGWTLGAGLSWNNGFETEVRRPTGRRPDGSVSTVPELRKQSSVVLVSLMARYQVSKDFSLQLNVDNAFDKKYANAVTNVATNPGGVIWGEPRSFRLTARYNF